MQEENAPHQFFYENYAYPDLWKKYYNDKDPLKELPFPPWLIFKDTPNNQLLKQDFANWFLSLDAAFKIQFYEGVLYTETYDHAIFEEFPKNVKEWGAKNFIPKLDRKFNIPELVRLNMPNLTLLSLSESNICNIQSLTYLQTPVLKQIDLTGNYIRQIKVLRKVSFKLERILLFENTVVDPEKYSCLQQSEEKKYIGFGYELQSPVFLAKVPSVAGQVLDLLKHKYMDPAQNQMDENEETDYYRRLIKSQSKVVRSLVKRKF